jgi:hypothetical protein
MNKIKKDIKKDTPKEKYDSIKERLSEIKTYAYKKWPDLKKMLENDENKIES